MGDIPEKTVNNWWISYGFSQAEYFWYRDSDKTVRLGPLISARSYTRYVCWEGTIEAFNDNDVPKEFWNLHAQFRLEACRIIGDIGDNLGTLFLKEGDEFPGKVGQRFRLVLELEEE